MKFTNKVKVKHSPGPWKAIRNSCYYDIKTAQDDYCQGIAGTHQNKYIGVDEDVEKANANLIAAAPDMYEALQRANQFITNGIELGYIRMPDADLQDPASETPGIIRKALKKANGEEEE